MILIGIDPIDLSLEYNDKKTLNNLLKNIFLKNNTTVKELINNNKYYKKYLSLSNLYNYRFFPYFFLDQIRMGRNKNGYNDLVEIIDNKRKNLVNNNLKCNQEVISKII